MPEITYGGPTARDDISTAFQVRDANGKTHLLRKGVATDVPDDVAKLLTGDDTPRGHKFEAKAKAPSASTGTKAGG